MFDPEDESRPVNPNPASEQTDRVNGEYHYKNGYTQRIYSDAHYVREDENTAPPRYYTPPEKTAHEAKEPRKGVGIGALIATCLICAILGGLCGGAAAGTILNRRVAAVEQSVSDLGDELERKTILPQTASTGAPVAEATHANALSAGDIYDRACQSVVGVTTEVTYTNFFGMSSAGAVTGSGFILTDDGYVMTNFHVIEDAYRGGLEVTVILHDSSRHTAEIVGVEPDNDIAILKIQAEGLTAVSIGNSDSLRVGDTVYAVGNPLGELEFSMTTGHVSAKDRAITTDVGSEAIPMFQFDAAVNSGNSGGPVFNDRGEVVGIVTAKASRSGVEGIGFAIPVNDAADIARDLMTKGYVTGKAHLGVTVNNKYNEMYAQYYGWPVGAYIDGVAEGSCAETAGIEAGDIITKVDGSEVKSYDDLRAAIKHHSAGDTVEIELYRADESRTVTVTFDEETPD